MFHFTIRVNDRAEERSLSCSRVLQYKNYAITTTKIWVFGSTKEKKMDTSTVMHGWNCLRNPAIKKTAISLFPEPLLSSQERQICTSTCSKWKVIQEQHSLFLSDKLLPPCGDYRAECETWWIHTAIHLATWCFHYFTTSLIPSSLSLSARMDGKHPGATCTPLLQLNWLSALG